MKWKLGAALSVLLSMAGVANAGPTVRFEDGAFGDVGQNTNVLAGKQVFPDPLRIEYVEITQPTTSTTFALQGNDLKVDLIIKPFEADPIRIYDAIINWRTTDGGKVTGFGIVPPPSITTPIVGAGNTVLFTVVGATATDAGTNIFLDHPIRDEGQLTAANDPEISGNAATAKTLLADLNSLLAAPAGPAMRVQKEGEIVGSSIEYTITVTNVSSGGESLEDVTIVDSLTLDGAATPVTLPVTVEAVVDGTGASAVSNDSYDVDDTDTVWDVLGPTDSITFKATVQLGAPPYSSATVFENIAVATALPFTFTDGTGGTARLFDPLIDTKTAGAQFSTESAADGNALPGTGAGSPTVIDLAVPTLRVTKIADITNVQTPAQVGDIIMYTITVENSGSVDMENVTLNDPLTDNENRVTADSDRILQVGDSYVYNASYTITQADLAAGKVENLATATGFTPGGTPVSVASSVLGNIIPEVSGEPTNGTPTVVTFGLIDQIEDDLRDILEADLRQTIQMQAARFSRMAKSALDRLKEGQSDECGTVTPLDADGSASTEGGTLNANITVEGETVDCVTGVRRIVTADVTSSTIEGMGQQIAGAFSIQRERFADEDSVRGRFWGGYVSSNQISGRGEGSVLGFGLNAGIYGADRLSSSLYLDHYLAVAAGRHSFDLAFGARDPISATGDYTYLAGFGGLALSGSVTSGKMEIAPRLAIDVAYAAAGDVNVVARQLGRTEIGTIKLADYEGARATAEIIFSNLDDAADADGFEIEAAPRLFCDFSLGGGQADNCGFGGYLSLNAIGGAGLDYAALIDFESSEDRDALTFSVERSQEIANGSGAIVSTMGMSEQGELSIGQMLNLRF